MVKENKKKIDSTCSFGNNADSISDFLIVCMSNLLFWRSWVTWWEAITGFNSREENHIHKSIYLDFPGVVMVPLS